MKAIVGGEGEITRSAVAALKAPRPPATAGARRTGAHAHGSLSAQANDLCSKLESLVARMTKPALAVTADELAALRRRLADLAGK